MAIKSLYFAFDPFALPPKGIICPWVIHTASNLDPVNQSHTLSHVIQYQEIEAYAQELVAKFKPEKVVLFGSYANDSASEDSDVDLLVIMPYPGKASRQALEIRKAVQKRFPLDLVVQSPLEASRRMQAGDPFITNALVEGRVLYGKH